MKILDRIAKRFGFVTTTALEERVEALNKEHAEKLANQKPVRIRNYAGADISRLTAGWIAPSTDANAELRRSVRVLRDRSRVAERDDDYMRRFLGLVENNVLGACGIGVQLKARKPNGQPDKIANDAIEMAWDKWGKKKNCCVNRQHTWRALCRLVLRAVKRDGGVFLRRFKGFANDFGYALQPIEIDHLDLDYVATLTNGNTVDSGIELNSFNEPVAYYLWRQHPGANRPNIRNNKRDRIPADEILHIFMPDRIAQIIGAPASSSALFRLKMLSGYEEAELVAAREAACKGYAIKQPAPDSYSGAAEDSQGRQLDPVEPGMGLLLQPGEEYVPISPDHPTTAYPDFSKSIKRGIASGLGVSYNSLANDLEGVNYSSMRHGLFEEREEWKAVQQWFIEEVCEPIFEEWLSWSLGFGYIKAGGGTLGIAYFDYYNQVEWKPRRWAWIDPVKDVEADTKAIAARLKSRRQVISEDGGDMDEIDADFASDPVTSGIDTESVYAPDSQPEPAEAEPVSANGVDRMKSLNGSQSH